MSLASGSSLGSYEIISTLGVGGMGEVYRARDTRLGREVAVKVVLEAFLLDRERLVRFEREAKSLAALNHPNIATLFGMEESEGRHFLVMELVEGETLAEKIARAPLPLEAAISTALQIADALETAHEKGIVHRDLKPANVKITPDDKVKVLDFGLARAMDPNAPADASPSGLSLANSPTMSAMATQAGVILGTASYMSPEQARGMRADHRSDIFSFGVVLYEMLTGRQPFEGDTVSDVLASVLARDPDLASLPPDLAPRLSELLRRCLEKHPKKRWQAIGDVRHELEIITSNPRHVPVTQTTVTVAEPPKPWWWRAMPIAAAAFGGAILMGSAIWMTRPTTPAGVVSRFVVPFGEDQRTSGARSPIVISPDGTRIAYTALPSRQIFVRAIGDLDARPITEVRTNYTPSSLVFSPQGNSIAYLDPLDTTIKRIDVAGGAPVTVCKATGVTGISWTGDTLVYAIRSGIMRVPAAGGEPEQLIAIGTDEDVSHPQLLEDGRVLFTLALSTDGTPAVSPWLKARIVLQKPGDSTRTTLVEGAVHARSLPTGHLVYWSGGVLFGRTFNPATSTLGGAVSLVEGVQGLTSRSGGFYDVSTTGSLVYVPGAVGGSEQVNYTIALTDRAGKAEPLAIPAGPYSQPRMSPDGRRVAFGFSDARDTSIWVYDIGTGGSARRLTFGGRDRFPVWSSDSQRVIFQSDREGDPGLFWQRADGVGAAERLTKPDKGVAHVAQSASRDGRWLLMDQTADSKTSLMAFSFKDKSATPFGGVVTTTPTGAIFSPDDRWVAYSERGTSSNVVYVQPFPATGAKVQISPNTEDGHHQVWSSDGKELYYTPGGGNRFTAVTVMASQGFAFGPAPPVTRLFLNNSPAVERTYDVARDGKRFLGLLSLEALAADASTRPEIRVVLNWFEELKARAPVK